MVKFDEILWKGSGIYIGCIFIGVGSSLAENLDGGGTRFLSSTSTILVLLEFMGLERRTVSIAVWQNCGKGPQSLRRYP
jgi:hypothetical protein